MNENQNSSVVTNSTQMVQNITPSTPVQPQTTPSVTVTPSVQTPVVSDAVTTAQPVAPVSPTVQPVSESTVTPENTTSTEVSPFFTPVSVKPETQVSPVLPEVTPTSPVTESSTLPSEPQVEASAPQTAETPNDVEVIQTVQKGEVSNVILIIFLILLIVFVINIDTVISMYDQYKETKTISNPTNKNTNNLTGGYILLDDSTSSMKVKDIKFYNFRKAQGKGITFSYEVLVKYDEAKDLEIYLELYNSEKELIYKELFNPSQKLEKDTVRTYVMSVDDSIYNEAFYSLVKIYSDKEKQEASSLTCTYEDKKYSYKYVFSFVNNGLSTYDVEKTSKNEDDEKLNTEYESLKDSNNATLENNTLKYKVDLSVDNDNVVTLFNKDATPKFVKNKQTSKEWNCE